MTKGEGKNEGKWSSRGKFRARRTALFKISFAICIVLPDRFLPFRASHSSATSPPPGYPINLKSSLGWYNLPSLFFSVSALFFLFFFCCFLLFFLLPSVHLLPSKSLLLRLIDEGGERYLFKSVRVRSWAWPLLARPWTPSCKKISICRAIKKILAKTNDLLFA